MKLSSSKTCVTTLRKRVPPRSTERRSRPTRGQLKFSARRSLLSAISTSVRYGNMKIARDQFTDKSTRRRLWHRSPCPQLNGRYRTSAKGFWPPCQKGAGILRQGPRIPETPFPCYPRRSQGLRQDPAY